jgi:nitroreductase
MFKGEYYLMNYQSLKEVILGRRSVRKFKDQPVPREIINELIDCARWAPSDTNQQPWKFIAITKRDIIKKIEETTIEGMEELKKKALDMKKPEIARKIDVFGRYALVFKNAPSLILCLSQPYSSKFTREIFDPINHAQEMWRDEGIKSASLASQNILLAAHALGYGTCAMSAPMILAEKKLKALLSIEEKYNITLMIALGVTEEHGGPTPRKELSEIIEYIE